MNRIKQHRPTLTGLTLNPGGFYELLFFLPTPSNLLTFYFCINTYFEQEIWIFYELELEMTKLKTISEPENKTFMHRRNITAT